MKVFFDVDVIVDILGKTNWFASSFIAYDVAMLRKCEVFVSAASLPTLSYVLHRRGIPRPDVQERIGALFGLVGIADVSESDCRRAHANAMKDFEDAIIAESAFRHGADLLITRNVKDYADSPVKAITPKEFATCFKPDNVIYDEVEL
ncbi:PIN domain-containing protein [Adlercreutzia sp. ZJ242]|uniref:PIN domain-containing protein n=1 Tax=Adlercreutzia sp. ZJ242 TaxID=2709409 RepID=UPI0013EA8CFC|nr:PIN domain-containing protein [Adlercreutzia sp. ZJ242]